MTNSTQNGKYSIIYKMDLAMEMIKRGHKVFTTMPNPQRPQLTAWVFEKDETFNEDFKKLLGKE
jgi:hypothetical protein